MRSAIIEPKWDATAQDQPDTGRPLFDGMPDLLTPRDLAGVLFQCEATIRRMCASGELPAVRIGRRWYVPRTLFMEFCEEADHGKS